MSSLAKTMREPVRGSQDQCRVMSNRTATTPTCLTSQPTYLAAPMTGGEQNAKLADYKARLRFGAGRFASQLLILAVGALN